jgi:hypothetical protein
VVVGGGARFVNKVVPRFSSSLNNFKLDGLAADIGDLFEITKAFNGGIIDIFTIVLLNIGVVQGSADLDGSLLWR